MYKLREEKIITVGEVDEAMALLRGVPIVEFEPPGQQIVRDEKGEYHTAETSGWIKLSIAFRDELHKLKGAKLSVFICICLHVNKNRVAWPSIRTICKETGYESEAVVKAAKELRASGLLNTTSRPGTSNLYRPLFAAYGIDSTPQNRNSPPPKSETLPPLKSETKEEPIKKNQEAEGESQPQLSPAASFYFSQFHRKRWATDAQRELFESTESSVGAERMMGAIRWAAESGIANLKSICTAARKGGRATPKPNTSSGWYANAPAANESGPWQ